MPSIIPSTKLRNEYKEVSRACHERMEPVFVTKNGEGDLVVMSIEAYEALAHRLELAEGLAQGKADADAGRTTAASEALSKLLAEFCR